MLKSPLFLLSFSLFTLSATSQTVINAYAKVTNISGTTLTLSNINETNHSFANGEDIIIMQMQDDIIGANTGDNSSFGDLSAISSAGLYEKATISTYVPSGTTIDLYNENFDDGVLMIGDNEDTGETAWTINSHTGGGTFQVDNADAIIGLSFSGANLGDVTTNWISETLDISSYSDVSISADLAETDYDANSDFVRLQYDLDGGGWTTIQTSRNNFGTSSPSISSINGSTLRVRVRIRNNGTTKRGIFDNVLIRGNTTSNTLILDGSLTNTYNTGVNSSVQIISYQSRASYTTSGNLTALPWDGDIGGVFAINVAGTLTLANNITTSSQGFRGGAANPTGLGGACDGTTYRINNDGYARKGEGIYLSTNNDYLAGRGKIINGGGGGNPHNGGGGGGGNFTAGGDGGPGWNRTAGGCNPTGGGAGGIDLSDHISGSRLYMGGGGGGGQQNNNLSDDGGIGGGIIIIKANTLLTNGGCGGLTISADGEDNGAAGNDGGAGAGAGGSVLFQVSTWSLNCQLDVSATGGDGEDVGSSAIHGGGGGGGKGVIILSGTAPSSNFGTDNSQGAGGQNGSGGGASSAPPGASNPSSGTADPDGLIESEEGPLPVELLNWQGCRKEGGVYLEWETATETNNDFFAIERSLNGRDWKVIAEVSGNGTKTSNSQYSYIDYYENVELVYYRLSQTDYDGTRELFETIAITGDQRLSNLLLFPNPSYGKFQVQLPSVEDLPLMNIEIIDTNGKRMTFNAERVSGKMEIDLIDRTPGLYFLTISSGVYRKTYRVRVR